MIITILLTIIIAVFQVFFNFMPVVTELPYGIDAILVEGMGYLSFLMEVFPPLSTMLTGFIVVLGFKLGMMVVKMIPFVGRAVS
jgi:hypothetical protein